MGDLKKKALTGVLWSGIDKAGVKAMSFIVSIVIARILTPSDYGIIGMIAVFISIANIIINSGMSQALVQKKNRTQQDMTTAFYFNIAMGFVCYLLLYLSAPYIAQFYQVDSLCVILRILGLNIIISSFSTVQRANLQANLDFKTIAYVNLIGVIVSGVIGIIMAYKGYGVWALVGQQIAYTGISTLVFWLFSKWYPKARFSKESLRALWNFGCKLLATGVVSTIMREIYSIAIGKYYRSSELGYYSRAVQTSDMVSLTTNDLINAVTFPILSSLQDDKSKMIDIYSRMLGMTAFFILPIMTGLAVVASPLIKIMLTEKWLPVVPLLQWLCFARMFTPISALNTNLLNAVGRSDLYMKIEFSKTPISIVTMLITIPLGVEAIVIGNFISTLICYFINAYLPGKMFNFGVIAQFKIFWKISIATGIMALCVWLSMLLFNQILFKLFIGIITGILTYAAISYILKIREYSEISKILSTCFSRINQ